MADEKKKTRRAKMNMAALWIAVATALAGTGVPKIIEILSDQPSTDQVQEMIAKSTTELAEQLDALTKVFDELSSRVSILQSIVVKGDDGARREPPSASVLEQAAEKQDDDPKPVNVPQFNKQTIQQRLQYALPKE